MVALNLSDEPREVVVGEGTLLISTHLDREGGNVSAEDILRGHEGITVKSSATK
jgi:hypothetical protein